MNSVNDILSKGCLVVLSISMYGASKKIAKNIMKERVGKHTKGSKKLLPDGALSEINSVKSAAVGWLDAISLPFPIRGARFIPFDRVEEADEILMNYQRRFNASVQEFAEVFEDRIEERRPQLEEDGLWDPNDYPRDVRTKFGFSWKFISIDAPSTEGNVLTPEFIKREQQKFIATLNEAKDMALNALRQEFYGIIEHAAEILTDKDKSGKRKKFNDSTIDKFYDFFENFTSRNCFGDSELEEIIEKAMEVMSGVDASDLRGDDEFRREIQEGLSKVKKEMDDAGIVKVGRKLNLLD